MIDLKNAQVVEVVLGAEGQVWVNVNGACTLRVYGAKTVILDDRRNPRVAIAKDVLARLDQMFIQTGRYIAVVNNRFRVSPGQELQPIVDQLEANCRVCALGGMLLSFIRLFDKIKSDDIESNLFNCATPTEVYEPLSEVFEDEQLVLIEAAFEKRDGLPSMYNYTEGFLRPAVKFGYQYDDPKDRLKAIMENIVENDGEFKP